MLKIVKGFFAAAPLVIFGLAWIPPQAFAQLLPCIPGITCPSPDRTPPTVSITSPASGATVSGTITVTAEASDNVGVAGVQFRYNGIDFDTEDTSAPYTAAAHTNNIPDGTYTLTAVARDQAGNRTTSEPVPITVANNSAPPAAVKRYEETDASVSYSPGWFQRNPDDWLAWSGRTVMESSTPGARATFTFTGTSVTWIGHRSGVSGIARVFVDDVFVAEVDLFARREEASARIFTVGGLTNSGHTLTIEVTGLKNQEAQFNEVVVDAFDVPAPAVSRLQDMDSFITYTAGWTGGDTSKPWSGGYATVSTTPGAQATLRFNGTAISWIGYLGPDTGIARVFLDGGFAGEVDTYSPKSKVQGTVVTSPPLADGSHTLTIEATGRKNDASSGTLILVDGFDVTTPGARFQETHSSVAYSGNWAGNNRNRPWNEGTATVSGTAGAQARFTFTGTSVSWIGFRAERTGIARIYLDGVFVTEVDTYAPTEGPQNTLFKAAGLANGEHTLTIEVTGRKNPASTNTYIVVDAFDVVQ
jgi:hypothetical protein